MYLHLDFTLTAVSFHLYVGYVSNGLFEAQADGQLQRMWNYLRDA